MFELLQQNDQVLLWLAIISILTFSLSLVTMPWVLLHLPHDYFSNEKRTMVHKLEDYPAVLQWSWVIVKNLIGLFFLLAGFMMLLLPGQGILTIFLGLALINFPGKFKLERWLITLGPAFNMVNRFREKHGKKALLIRPHD
jgi:hypothetical protein